MKEYFDLFFTWSRIGLFTFGGGYAMLPLIEKEVIEKKKWASYEEVMDYYSIGQCTPGIIAVNTATFIGYKVKRISGGIIATLGVIFPSLVIITLIATILTNFADLPLVQSALKGIRIGVCALMIPSIYKLFKKNIKDTYAFTIFIIILIAAVFNVVSVSFLIIIAAMLGLLFSKIKNKGDQI